MLKLVKANKIIRSSIDINKLYNKYFKSDSINIKDTIVSEEDLAEELSELLYEVYTLTNKFFICLFIKA